MFERALTWFLGGLRGMPEGAGANLKAICRHTDRIFGREAQHLHEKYSPDIHLDLLHYAPSHDHDFHYVVTSGVSDRAMTAGGKPVEFPFVELAMALPATWEVSEAGFKKPGMWEPFRLLKTLARYPHQQGTYFALSHTVPLGEDPAFTPMSAVLLMPPVLMRELAEPLRVSADLEIQFLAAYLIHPEELAWKLEGRLDDLLGAFGERSITETFDLSRPSVCAPA